MSFFTLAFRNPLRPRMIIHSMRNGHERNDPTVTNRDVRSVRNEPTKAKPASRPDVH